MLKQKRFNFSIPLCLALVLSAVFAPEAHGQTQGSGVIEGRILSADLQPQENVIIVLSPSEKQTMSDDNGHFEFRNVPYGRYTISIKSLGVTAAPVSAELNASKVSVSDIHLEEVASVLDKVIVSSSYRHVNKNSAQVARLPLTYTENPQNYAVIPKELLSTQLVTTTEQALINIPGVSNLSIAGGSGGSALIFKSRGFSSGSIMYRNGVSSGYVSLTDLFNIERIEAIKGPSSTLFGGNQGASYGGVYNLVTKKPLEVQRGEVSFTTGSYDLARTTVDYNTPLNEDKTALLRLDAMYDSRNTFQELAQNNVGFAPSLLIKATDRLTLHFDGYYYKSVRPILLFGFDPPPGGGDATSTYAGNVSSLGLDPKNPYVTPDFNSKQQTWSVTGQAEYQLSPRWLSQTNYSLARSNNETYYISMIANKSSATTDTTTVSRSVLYMPYSQLYTQQFQQNFIGDFNIGSLRNRLLVGLDYFRTNVGSSRGSVSYDKVFTNASPAQLLMRKSRVDSLAANASYRGGRDISNSYGAYISNVLNITDQLLIMASLRVNRFVVPGNYMQTSYSPKIGLSYEIIDKALSVYANYNNGYNNVAGTDSLDNLLKPEYANQLEGGIKFDVLQHRLTGTLSVYDINVKNKARALPGTIYSVQDNEQRSRGVDVDILANPVAGLNIALGYGYNDIRYSKFTGTPSVEGNRVESAPYHAGNIWGTYQFTSGKLKGFGLGAGGNGQSSSFANAGNTITLDGFYVYGASVFYNALKFRVGAKIDNIANQKYYTYSSWLFAGQPRMLAFNITYRF